jgi:hypothetical protein
VLYGAAQLRRQRSLPMAREITDFDQNAYQKSWLTYEDTLEMLQAVRAVYLTTSGKDFYPNAYAHELTKISAADVVACALQRTRTADPASVPMLTPHAPTVPTWRARQRSIEN